jgi:phage shock protein B
MDAPEFFSLLAVMLTLFIGLPWLVFHYVTKWKSTATISSEDEKLLDELHDLGRRLDDRVATIERIMSAENPAWRQIAADPVNLGIESRIEERSRIQ